MPHKRSEAKKQLRRERRAAQLAQRVEQKASPSLASSETVITSASKRTRSESVARAFPLKTRKEKKKKKNERMKKRNPTRARRR